AAGSTEVLAPSVCRLQVHSVRRAQSNLRFQGMIVRAVVLGDEIDHSELRVGNDEVLRESIGSQYRAISNGGRQTRILCRRVAQRIERVCERLVISVRQIR